MVFTGGEPLLQLDAPWSTRLHARGFAIAIETNGTIEPPPGIDWICVSPKGTATLSRSRAATNSSWSTRKPMRRPEAYAHLDFQHFFLQPMDGPARAANTERAVQYCMAHPQWRLSLQTHKYIGIP